MLPAADKRDRGTPTRLNSHTDMGNNSQRASEDPASIFMCFVIYVSVRVHTPVFACMHVLTHTSLW